MIYQYLELRVRNEIHILKKLYSSEECKINYLVDLLEVTKPTIYNYVSEMSYLLEKEINVKNNYVLLEDLGNYEADLHKLYQSSSFLKIFSFFLEEQSNKNFKKFIQNNFLSRAKAYTVRKQVIDYLSKNGLEIGIHNNLTGDPLKIVLLKAKFETIFGIKVVPEYIYNAYKESVDALLEKCTVPYLSSYNAKMFESVVYQLICTDNYFDFIHSIKFNELFRIPESVNKSIVDFTKKIYQESEIEIKRHNLFFFFRLFTTSAFVVQDKEILQLDIELIQLLTEFKKEFGSTLIDSKFFYYLLLDCLKIDQTGCYEFLVEEKYNRECEPEILSKVLKIVEKWLENPEHFLDENVVHFFCLKLEEIFYLISKMKINIYSDSYMEYLDIYYFLRNNLKVDIEIVDVWIYSLAQLTILDAKTRIIVTSVKNTNQFSDHPENVFFIEMPFNQQNINGLNKKILTYLIDHQQ
ncbi:helix-turn-helix domain-containing protein [Enterococcus faecium]|uniref:helix-turn-helix domain-containing protein n=1 Tax=Enterococcus faecium TaxID=1352 RepID=UPI0035E09FAE